MTYTKDAPVLVTIKSIAIYSIALAGLRYTWAYNTFLSISAAVVVFSSNTNSNSESLPGLATQCPSGEE